MNGLTLCRSVNNGWFTIKSIKNLIFYCSLVVVVFSLIKVFKFLNENSISIKEKSLDYFKTKVNWNEYPIVEDKNLILVLGEARSGTSFLADLLHQSWPTFYSFEPLFLMKGQNLRDDPINSGTALGILYKIFNCDFENLNNFALSLWKNERNLVIQKYPEMNKSLVWNKRINQFVCQRCDNLLIKSIRISVKQFTQLHQNLKNRIKLVFIVRDPRGVMSSRYLPSMDWCRTDNQCSQIGTLCKRMKDDLNELVKISRNSPEMISLIRYEDISLNTIETSKSLFKKLSLNFTLGVQNWIKRHTNNEKHLADPYSTVRMSREVTFSWAKRLNFSHVNAIQKQCRQVMDILGYNSINSDIFSKIQNNFFSVENILRKNFELDHLIPKLNN